MRIVQKALDIQGIKQVSFWKRNGSVRGVARDELTGQEYDLRRHRGRWLVSDDEGAVTSGLTLRRAINKTRKKNA